MPAIFLLKPAKLLLGTIKFEIIEIIQRLSGFELNRDVANQDNGSILAGCFLFGFRITFSQCWSVVMAGEFIFILPELLKIGWFLFIETDPNLNDIRAFYPLSLMNFFDYFEIDKRYAYPLRALNVFEILYILILVNGVHYYAKREKKAAWWIVSTSYILLFIVWLCFYMIVYK